MREQKMKKQLAHLFDATRCISCQACIVSCQETNFPELINQELPSSGKLATNIHRVIVETAKRPFQVLVQCQQCQDAPCVKTCPFGANYYDEETGMVKTHEELCIGCNYCVASCPYDCRWSHPISGLPMKCMGPGCEELVKNGQQPACVSACPVNARMFGDVQDPTSLISQRIAASRTEKLLPHKQTRPNFFVVVTK